jgi:hypothetical protein
MDVLAAAIREEANVRRGTGRVNGALPMKHGWGASQLLPDDHPASVAALEPGESAADGHVVAPLQRGYV